MKKKNEDDKREITVSIDRVKLTLSKYQNKKSFMAEIISYFGSILTLLITVGTGQYSSFWFLSAEAMQGVFIALLVIMVIVTIFRIVYAVVIKSSIYDEKSFVDSLEYNESLKTNQEINKKRKIIINVFLSLGLILIISAYLGFGFLAKWHLAYCVFVTFIALVLLIGYICEWESMFTYFYEKIEKKDSDVSIDN